MMVLRARRGGTGNKIAEALSRARHLARLPRKRRRRLTTHLQVIIDRSDRLVPFWDDQDLVDAVLRRLVPPHRRSHGLIHEALDEPRLLGAGGTRIAYSSPPPGGVVLVLGDLGCLDHAGREATERWRRFGRRIAASNTIASALLPAPSARFPRALRTIWRTAPWERSSPTPADAESLQSRADRLLALASPAVRIEPGLLRALAPRSRTYLCRACRSAAGRTGQSADLRMIWLCVEAGLAA